MEKNIIQRLIDAGVITEQDVNEYNTQKATGLIKQQAEQSKDDEIKAEVKKKFGEIYEKNLSEEHAVIENGVLVSFKEGINTESYVVPNYVTKIKSKAFYDCKQLKQVIIPNGIKEIKHATFAHCSNLESVILPDSIEAIENDAFIGCGIEYINLPKNLKIIGHSAFYETKLKEIQLPDSVEQVGYRAFENNNHLTKVALSSGLKVIRNKTFSGCNNLQEIVMPEGVEQIRECAFAGCINLERVYLPQSLESIDKSAFWSCSRLINVNANSVNKKVNLPSNIRYLCYTAFNGTPIEKLVREIAYKNQIVQYPGQTFDEPKTK